MPRLWFLPDGSPASSRKDSSLPISFSDFNRAFGDAHVRFFQDRPPTLDAGMPAITPARVLLEVTHEERAPPLFLRPGCYLLEHISPSDARRRLHDLGLR